MLTIEALNYTLSPEIDNGALEGGVYANGKTNKVRAASNAHDGYTTLQIKIVFHNVLFSVI